MGYLLSQDVYLEPVNKLYMEIFPEGKRPARTIYQAAALPFGGKVKDSIT